MGVGCGCAGVERATLTIAVAGGGGIRRSDDPKIVGPQGKREGRKTAVYCSGAALVIQGLAVEAHGQDGLSDTAHALYCSAKGRAELSGCTLTSNHTGLHVEDGSTVTMDGGGISGGLQPILGDFQIRTGVEVGNDCTVTVRPPVRLRVACVAAFLGPFSLSFLLKAPAFWGACG